MCGGAWDEIKKPHYKVIQEVSRFAAKTGDKWGWDFQKEEGEKNTENPGRAITKAAPYVLGGLFSAFGGAGAAGANAASATTAGGQVAKTAAEKAAEEALKQEILNSAQYAGQQGLLSSGGVMDGMAGLSGSMESGLLDTGYTPSSLYNAFRYGPNSGQGMGQTLGNYAGNKAQLFRQTAQNNPMGLLGGKQGAARMGASLLSQPQPQPQPYNPPPPAPQQQQPMPQMYGDLSMLDEETKRRLRAAGYPI